MSPLTAIGAPQEDSRRIWKPVEREALKAPAAAPPPRRSQSLGALTAARGRASGRTWAAGTARPVSQPRAASQPPAQRTSEAGKRQPERQPRVWHGRAPASTNRSPARPKSKPTPRLTLSALPNNGWMPSLGSRPPIPAPLPRALLRKMPPPPTLGRPRSAGPPRSRGAAAPRGATPPPKSKPAPVVTPEPVGSSQDAGGPRVWRGSAPPPSRSNALAAPDRDAAQRGSEPGRSWSGRGARALPREAENPKSGLRAAGRTPRGQAV